MRDHGSQLQWHSRLARRTYKSVLTKKCEGREFEPPLEQVFYIIFLIVKTIQTRNTYGFFQNQLLWVIQSTNME